MSRSIFDEYDIFKTMHPVKVEVMKELVKNMQGRQMKEAAPLLMAAGSRLQGQNLSFTPEEVSVLMEILTKDMSPEEKARVEMMKNIVRKKR
ncbi:MAG: hypothetical protein J1F02_08805 [Lachnospiraceae bacterium]|nr:hypothetical protein [Lachnospiraceae bacterium]